MTLYTKIADQLVRAESTRVGDLWFRALGLEDHHIFFRDNRKAFKIVWGDFSCTFTGEYRHWIWLRSVPGYSFAVLTGRRGTSIEIDPNMPADSVLDALEYVLVACKAGGAPGVKLSARQLEVLKAIADHGADWIHKVPTNMATARTHQHWGCALSGLRQVVFRLVALGLVQLDGEALLKDARVTPAGRSRFLGA